MTAGGTSAEVPGPHGSRHRSRLPWRPLTMEIAFAAGSACFLIGPFPGYVQLVGPAADAITFFVGSVLFTIGGALQLWLAAPVRRQGGAGRAAFLAALAQTLGTLFFNRTTFQALQTAVTAPDYNHLVWRPDAFGSICFLLSGIIGYRASVRRGWRLVRTGPGWRVPAINLAGCIFFGIAAIAGYVVPASGSMLDLAAANWTTAVGAACFLICAVVGLVDAGDGSLNSADDLPA